MPDRAQHQSTTRCGSETISSTVGGGVEANGEGKGIARGLSGEIFPPRKIVGCDP